MNYDEVLAYYSRLQVRSEIASYCIGRWVALEGEEQGGGRLFLRYWKHGEKPMTIVSPEELDKAFRRFRVLNPRTVYASINVYDKLRSITDAENPSNIVKSTPIWDVDASLDQWEDALKAADLIVSHLAKEGLERSLFLKWSGRGIHIHIHEGAFSQNLLSEHNPLDVAFTVVEHILRRVRGELARLVARASPSAERPLKVENKIDLKRVFTAPLSLHRQLDLCCVCFKPNDVYNFNPEWAKPERYRHDESWKVYEEGEGDSLANKALAEVGGYDGWPKAPKPRQARTAIQAEATIEVPAGKLGRFQVMGLLQAARYYLVNGNMDKAKSFGLNRAIFYAWAKRYARERLVHPRGTEVPAYAEAKRIEQLGDEAAYLSPKELFMIGDAEQTPSEYDNQIASRIDATTPYEEAWSAAVEYIRGFPRATLLSQQRFYNEIYKPIRDTFHNLIGRRRKSMKQQTLDKLF